MFYALHGIEFFLLFEKKRLCYMAVPQRVFHAEFMCQVLRIDDVALPHIVAGKHELNAFAFIKNALRP